MSRHISPTNTESIIFYKSLILDAQDGIADAEALVDPVAKQHAVDSFNKLISEHNSNIERLKKQAEDAEENLIDEIQAFIDKYSGWLITLGGLLGEEFKRGLVKLINAAKKILEELENL